MPEPLRHRVAVYFGVAEPTEDERRGASEVPSLRRRIIGFSIIIGTGWAVGLALFPGSVAEALVFGLGMGLLSLTFRLVAARND